MFYSVSNLVLIAVKDAIFKWIFFFLNIFNFYYSVSNEAIWNYFSSYDCKTFLLAVRELHELSEKKQLLLEDLESNWKELQEVQALAATQPGSVSGMCALIWCIF